MEHDKVFNLQLTIQKLQEEVSLYRNGADSNEIFQLITEKEIEIKSLNASAASKNENLRKLAKKSAEVLARCDRVQSDYDTLQFEHSDLIQEKKQLISDVESLMTTKALSIARCEEGKQAISLLEEELNRREESIEKLQARCALLVSQKNEKNREYELMAKHNAAERSEKNKHTNELMDEFERAMRFNTEIKERLNREHANSLDLSAKLMETRKNLDATTKSNGDLEVKLENLNNEIKDSTRAKCQLESDLFDMKRLLSAATSGASESETQLRGILAVKDSEIAKLNQSLKALMERSAADLERIEEEGRTLVSRIEEDSRAEVLLVKDASKLQVSRTEDERKAEVSRIEEECRAEVLRVERECRTEVLRAKEESNTLSKKVKKLEADRDLTLTSQRDLDTLKAKNNELEEKIKRQDQYMKSRLLRDKTNYNPNALCTPEPSEPCYRPPSARAIAIAATAATHMGPTTEVRAPQGLIRPVTSSMR